MLEARVTADNVDTTNVVEHTHDTFTYRYALTHTGQLVREYTPLYARPVWETVSFCPQGESDTETGEWYPVDETREDYLRALIVILATTAKG